jgi:glycosyltransferase involved in cell wall biosynthesis
MPLTIIEGFAAGLPCVATDVGSCRDLIEGGNEEDKKLGNAGFVAPIANPAALADGYIKLLNDNDLYRKCQNTAIKRVETFYTKEIFLNSYRDLYNNFLKDKKWQA